MKKLINLEIHIYYNMDEVNFEDLEPIKILYSWSELNLFMENKNSEAYTVLTHGQYFDTKEEFLEKALA